MNCNVIMYNVIHRLFHVFLLIDLIIIINCKIEQNKTKGTIDYCFYHCFCSPFSSYSVSLSRPLCLVFRLLECCFYGLLKP